MKEQNAKSLHTSLTIEQFKSPAESPIRNVYPAQITGKDGKNETTEQHLAILISSHREKEDDQQSKTKRDQAMPLTSRDVSNCEKTHDNRSNKVVQSPTISAK